MADRRKMRKRNPEKAPQSIFDILPVKMISRVLSFMDEREYSGLPCTCRRALELVNAAWIEEHGIIEDKYRGPELSLTGRWFRLLRGYEEEFKNQGCYTVDEDPDL